MAALSVAHNVLDAMEADAAAIARRMADAVLREVAEHRAVRDERFAAEVFEHSHRHVLAFVAAGRSGRVPSGVALDFVRERGAQRARELLPLDAVLQSYLLGQRLMWEAVVERAPDASAALALSEVTYEYAAAVNAAVAEGWTAGAREVAAEEEQDRRHVLDRLLAGDPAVARRAAALGVEAAEGLFVAVVAGAPVAVIAAAAPGTFVVAHADEVVALPAAEPLAVLERARAVLARRSARAQLRAGVSRCCAALAEVPRAYEEARRALRHASAERPVVRLEDVRLADELACSADEVARATVPAAARMIASHPDLRATVVAFAEHDLNVARTAAALHVHPNTIQYRLRRVEQLTGADIRRFQTMLDLVLGLAVLER
jgi:hypothetical protein